MSTLKTIQWVSCLALAALAASCSGQAGSPIQENLDAQQQSAAGPYYDIEQDYMVLPGTPDMVVEPQGRTASYTPGLPAMVGGGVSMPSPLQYGWKAGLVTDMGSQVHLLSTPSSPLSWNAYAFKEMAPGALQQVVLKGFGVGLAVFAYDWNTTSWTFKGIHNLSAAAATPIPITPGEAPNGVTFMIMLQTAPAETFITGLETHVF
jgi:hypothetical protein